MSKGRKLAGPKKSSAKNGTAKKTVKVKFATYVRNQGDGSVVVLYFKDEKEAEKCASPDDERLQEDVASAEFLVDASTGRIVRGLDDVSDFEGGND